MENEWPLSQRHHVIAELPQKTPSGVLPPFFSVAHCRSSSLRPFSSQNSRRLSPHALTFLVRRNPYSVPPLAAERDENHDEIEKRSLETQAKRPTKRKNAHKSTVSKNRVFETGFFVRENRLLLISDIFRAIFSIDSNVEYCALLVQAWTEYGFCPM